MFIFKKRPPLQKYKILTFLGISFLLFFLFTHINFAYFLNTDFRKEGPQIHVFIDVASGPSLLQLIEFIKMDPSTESKKIIAWNTIRDIHKKINLKNYNAQEISYDNLTKNLPIKELAERVGSLLMKELKNNPESRVILYTNLHHAEDLAEPLIKMIKPHKIAHLHLYEDGFGNTTASRKGEILAHPFSFLEPSKKHAAYGYYLFKKYPVTYHLAFNKERYSDPDFKKFNKFFKKAIIKETNFTQLKASLSEEEKKILTQIFSINPAKYQKIYKQSPQPVAFLLTPWSRIAWEEEAHLNALLKILKDDRYSWILKPHPNIASLKMIEKIKKHYPNIMVVENETPMEVFFLTDCLPKFIAGFSSSSFLSLDPKYFLYYIERTNDEYLPFLIKEGKLNPKQVIKLDFKGRFILQKLSWQKDKRLVPTYVNSDLYFLVEDKVYGKIISFNNNILKIKWLDKTEEQFICNKNKVCISQIHNKEKASVWNKIKLLFK